MLTTTQSPLTGVIEHRVEVPVRPADRPDGDPVCMPIQHEGALDVVARCADVADALTPRRHQVHSVQSREGRVQDLLRERPVPTVVSFSQVGGYHHGCQATPTSQGSAASGYGRPRTVTSKPC